MIWDITQVQRGSPAYRAGIKPGWQLKQINGESMEDFIDYYYFSAMDRLELLVQDGKGREKLLSVRKRAEAPLGLTFAQDLYPGEKRCANRCVFCFVDQMPPNMRESLYVKDDDWRYSLLFGNFVTLSNLSQQQFARMLARKPSPIYISVHATNADVRCRLMQNPHCGPILEQLHSMAQAGITFHCQVVLCPGINDADVLQQTLQDLWNLYPAARSVAVVPLGMTQFREGLTPLQPVDQTCARQVVAQIEAFARRCQQERGISFAFASDEFYAKAQLPWPEYDSDEYTGQSANGVGIMQDLLGEFDPAVEDLAGRDLGDRHVLLATGVSAAPTMQQLGDRLCRAVNGLQVQVKAVENHFFGLSITVAGLLTGRDILEAAKPLCEWADALLIPGSTLKDDRIFLDDMTLEQLEQALGIPVTPVPDDGYALALCMAGLTESEV